MCLDGHTFYFRNCHSWYQGLTLKECSRKGSLHLCAAPPWQVLLVPTARCHPKPSAQPLALRILPHAHSRDRTRAFRFSAHLLASRAVFCMQTSSAPPPCHGPTPLTAHHCCSGACAGSPQGPPRTPCGYWAQSPLCSGQLPSSEDSWSSLSSVLHLPHTWGVGTHFLRLTFILKLFLRKKKQSSPPTIKKLSEPQSGVYRGGLQ